MAAHIVVIGGGAAGFFGAVTCARENPALEVILIEKTNKLLGKVKVSGGGRCNVTHHCFHTNQLARHYPRGEKFLKKAFQQFGARETVDWFEQRGVALKTEADGRMFPVTDDSQTIIDCLLQEARQLGVRILTGTAVTDLSPHPDGFRVGLNDGQTLEAAKVLVCTGGAPKPENYTWLADLGITIVPPVPSLFTFNVPRSAFKELSGISVDSGKVKIAGQPLEEQGPMLITHWGFSGPAVLKTSAWGARVLHDLGYCFTALLNWAPDWPEDKLRAVLQEYRHHYPRRMVIANPLFKLPLRLWKALVTEAGIANNVIWAELPGKNQNKLVEQLLRQPVEVQGKTTFKEEFVTCGGVDLAEVDPNSMASKKLPHLFFAGEVLDIDGITGGFNFQSAWTTGYLAGKAMAKS